MGRVLIIAEGQTEEKFLKGVVFPYFYAKGLYDISVSILPSKITASGKRFKGGFITSKKIINYAKRLINSGIVTTFIDYYGIDSEFVGYKKSLDLREVSEKKSCLEDALNEELSSPNFIPYIQMYEFEGLLFSDVDAFEWIDEERGRVELLKSEVSIFESPEHVNNSKETAPSKRIERHYPSYKKTVDGILIAEGIGLEKIMEECPLFKEWVEKLEEALRG